MNVVFLTFLTQDDYDEEEDEEEEGNRKRKRKKPRFGGFILDEAEVDDEVIGERFPVLVCLYQK